MASSTIRLVFSYEGDQVSLESAQRVEMLPLPSHAVSGYDGEAGFWVEVRDGADRVLHRRVLHEPMPHSVEVFPESADDQFTQAPVAEPRGSFDVIVPDIPGAQVVGVFASLPEPAPPAESAVDAAARVSAGRIRPAREIARFPLPAEDGE
ncbi:hypothetical protein J5X84_30490 [Streptosporangiaceae bacterium NEAU-GS5]|nr:hypothetical protein [Streptosporangiaceae bacterium NEAU-GS5]